MMRPRTHGGAPRVFRLTQLWPRLKMSPVRLAENAITIKEREREQSLCSYVPSRKQKGQTGNGD